MRIDCPGAEYDPENKGKFSDCTRWDVEPHACGEYVALLSLDWNWAVRARAQHGPATMIITP